MGSHLSWRRCKESRYRDLGSGWKTVACDGRAAEGGRNIQQRVIWRLVFAETIVLAWMGQARIRVSPEQGLTKVHRAPTKRELIQNSVKVIPTKENQIYADITTTTPRTIIAAKRFFLRTKPTRTTTVERKRTTSTCVCGNQEFIRRARLRYCLLP
jgi:hypothetical protein